MINTRFKTTQAPVRPQALVVNAGFTNQASHYVTLADRFNSLWQNPEYQTALQYAINTWRMHNPHVRQWGDIMLGQAKSVSLSEIQIDTTLQREVVVSWLCTILQEFKALRVQALNVYQDTQQPRPHMYTCWDGQHTALTLYVVATQILKLDPRTCEVPVFIHPSSSRAEMRDNFTHLNSIGKLPVSTAALFRQKVLGVRVDKSTDPEWKETERKQQILEQYHLFVCEETDAACTQAGAITNMSELLATGLIGRGKRYTLQDLEYFCALMNTCGLDRPVKSPEMWQWMDLFALCRVRNIVVDQSYLDQIVHMMNHCFGGFHSMKLHDTGREAYLDWFRNDHGGKATGHSWHGETRKKLHLTWICALLKSHTSLKVPNQSVDLWTPYADQMAVTNLR